MASLASEKNLSQLLDSALLTPHVIKYDELHSILQVVLQHLGLQNMCLQEAGQSQPPEVLSVSTSVAEMKDRIEANETTTKALLEEINELKATQSRMAEAAREEMQAKMAEQQAQLEELKATADTIRDEAKASIASLRREHEKVWEEYSNSTRDMSAQLEHLRRSFKNLQEQAVRKNQNMLEELQASVRHLQKEHEKLSSDLGNVQDNWQKTKKEMEVFFETLQKVEKEKADKEEVMHGIAQKADKASLARKVSRDSLEAITERLNEKLEKMESQGLGQEQGLQEMQQQLKEAVDTKLDRQELEPLKQQLENLKTMLEELKEKGPQRTGAAGLKYPQTHCHCLSCDKVLSEEMPGPNVAALPLMTPMPSHRQRETQEHGQREWMDEHKFPRVQRSSGGQHTASYPLAFQPKPPSTRPPNQYEETLLLGRDGRVYRGQRRRQEAVFSAKDGSTAFGTTCDGRFLQPLVLPALPLLRGSLGAKQDKHGQLQA